MTPRLPYAHISHLRYHLRRGGLIAYPTESVYGIGCLPHQQHALKRLMRLKQRPQHKGLIVIGHDLTQLTPLLKPLQNHQLEYTQQWPAALTLLLPAATDIPILLRGKRRQQLAVRVPDHAPARALCQRIGSALVSTSCNKSGQRPCRSEREVRRRFGQTVIVIGGRCGGRRQPSRIIDPDTGHILR